MTFLLFSPATALLGAFPNSPVATGRSVGLELRDSYTARQLRCLPVPVAPGLVAYRWDYLATNRSTCAA